MKIKKLCASWSSTFLKKKEKQEQKVKLKEERKSKKIRACKRALQNNDSHTTIKRQKWKNGASDEEENLAWRKKVDEEEKEKVKVKEKEKEVETQKDDFIHYV